MTLDELAMRKVMGWDDEYVAWRRANWSPTTNIAHAWEMVEKMKGMWVQVSYQPMSDDGMEHEKCNASFQPVGGARALGMAQASTAPLAITLAALRACGVTEEEIEAAQEHRP